MAIAAGQPKPRIWVVPDPDPNAFATGRDAAHGQHRGHGGTAPDAQSRGAAGRRGARDGPHRELGHPAHDAARRHGRRDRADVGWAGTDDAGWRARSERRRGASGESGKGGNPLGIVLLVLWVFTLLIAPVVSRLLAMAVSRKREYLADATGAQFTRNPMALASALEKLETARRRPAPSRRARRISASWIRRRGCSPRARERSPTRFASHPPIRQRIARLKGMGYLGEVAAPKA